MSTTLEPVTIGIMIAQFRGRSNPTNAHRSRSAQAPAAARDGTGIRRCGLWHFVEPALHVQLIPQEVSAAAQYHRKDPVEFAGGPSVYLPRRVDRALGEGSRPQGTYQWWLPSVWMLSFRLRGAPCRFNRPRGREWSNGSTSADPI